MDKSDLFFPVELKTVLGKTKTYCSPNETKKKLVQYSSSVNKECSNYIILNYM